MTIDINKLAAECVNRGMTVERDADLTIIATPKGAPPFERTIHCKLISRQPDGVLRVVTDTGAMWVYQPGQYR